MSTTLSVLSSFRRIQRVSTCSSMSKINTNNSLAGTLYYVENQIGLLDHWDYYMHMPSSFYCDNAYCDTFDSWTNLPEIFKTRVESISKEQCMDLCLCDEDCIIFAFATYTCYEGDIASLGTSGQDPGQFHPCSMCRIYPTNVQGGYQTFGNHPGFVRFNSTNQEILDGVPSNVFVGTKSATMIPQFAAQSSGITGCVDREVCENPLQFSGTAALDVGGNKTCFDCIVLDDCAQENGLY